MIEVAAWPADLATWDPGQQPFYLELGGESRPYVERAVVPGRHRWNGADDRDYEDRDHDDGPNLGGPVYEYSWTLGHPGDGALADPWWHHLRAPRRQAWNDLDDPAARIYLYFPTQAGWRADELATNLTYLAPVHHQPNLHDQAADDWSKIQPVLAGAGEVASRVAGFAGLGPVGAGVAPVLAAAAKMQINRVPPSNTYAWTVAKVAARTEADGFLQGVMWTVPRQAFTDLGGRITGTLAVTIQASSYQGATVATEARLEPRAALASAVIHHDGGWTEVPGAGQFVRLTIHPRID